jgi:hypothetical protein
LSININLYHGRSITRGESIAKSQRIAKGSEKGSLSNKAAGEILDFIVQTVTKKPRTPSRYLNSASSFLLSARLARAEILPQTRPSI